MTRSERVGMWGLVAGLVVCAYGVSLRIDTLDNRVSRLAPPPATSTSSATTTTTQPLEAAVAGLRREVEELRANRGLSGPEVRTLLETLLPAPGCVEPPCDSTSTTVWFAPPPTAVTTTVKR